MRRGSGALRYLPPLAVFLAIIGGAEAFRVLTNQPAYVLPSIVTVLETAVDDAEPTLLPNARVTLKEIVGGFALAVAAGVVLGIATGLSPLLERSFYPVIIASQTVPVIAIAPVMIIWFGFGSLPKILVAALIAFFPVAINTTAGVRSVDKETIALMRSFAASRVAVFRMVQLPAALPQIFVGLKNAAVISVIGAVAGEWVGGESGLGPVMLIALAGFDTDLVFAAILYLAAIGVGLFAVVALAERIAIPWYRVVKSHAA